MSNYVQKIFQADYKGHQIESPRDNTIQLSDYAASLSIECDRETWDEILQVLAEKPFLGCHPFSYEVPTVKKNGRLQLAEGEATITGLLFNNTQHADRTKCQITYTVEKEDLQQEASKDFFRGLAMAMDPYLPEGTVSKLRKECGINKEPPINGWEPFKGEPLSPEDLRIIEKSLERVKEGGLLEPLRPFNIRSLPLESDEYGKKILMKDYAEFEAKIALPIRYQIDPLVDVDGYSYITEPSGSLTSLALVLVATADFGDVLAGEFIHVECPITDEDIKEHGKQFLINYIIDLARFPLHFGNQIS